MRYHFTYEPPQPNSPLEMVLHQDQSFKRLHDTPAITLNPTQNGLEEDCAKPRGEWGFTPHSQTPNKAILNSPFWDEKEPPTRLNAQRYMTLKLEKGTPREATPHILCSVMRKTMSKVEVFHCRPKSPSYATPPESFLVSN